jgi:hypothetical protein
MNTEMARADYIRRLIESWNLAAKGARRMQ